MAFLAFALAAISALLVVIAGPGHRLGWWHYSTGLGMLRWGFYGALASVVLALPGALLAWRARRRPALGWAVAGLAIALIAGSVPFSMLRTARALPPIHDITTDTENPPAFVAVLPLRRGAPNSAAYGGSEVARQQRQAYPDLAPAVLAIPAEQAFARALSVVRELGWEVAAAEPREGRIEATATTRWFGFKDDVVVRIAPHDTGARVDVRSVSRVGCSDLGANARRIREFLRALRDSAPP